MAFIECCDVSLAYPVYNNDSFSLRHTLLNLSTGGVVAKSAKEKTIIKALDHLNFKINEGDRVAVLGHNGAGKTTLLRCLAGIYKPTAGVIKKQGKVTPLIEIGAGVEPELSGFDNIKRLQFFYGITDSRTSQVEEIAEFSELGDFLNLPVRTYSSGMMMRLMFAIATTIEPDILVMDEFFSVGDADFQKKAERHLIDKINQASILVFASHDHHLLTKFCNRFFVLNKGQLTEVEAIV